MKPASLLRIFPVLALLLLPLKASCDMKIADVENFGDTLRFYPVVEFNRLVLSVTGPCGFEYRQEVTDGQPVFKLDPTTINGTYRYQLVRFEAVHPDVIKILQDAREAQNPEIPKELCRDGMLPAAPQGQSAGFQVSGGKIIYDPGTFEKSSQGQDADVDPADAGILYDAGVYTRDFVINDDLIVDGSGCIGFDCVNGESFGFDTLRLKENNLRIKFDDTSVAASYPRTDWQLTANDSANGGASKFSIDDISGNRTPLTVEANSRSHALYVDDGGRIGSRTSTPSTEFHTVDGDTPTVRLEQDGSSGFAPQTWDVAGNETNFFVRDVTNGSSLPLRIRPGAPTSSLFIDAEGNVGVGTSSPASRLDIVGALEVSDGATVTGGFSASSTREIKKDFESIDRHALVERLRSLPVVTWSYIKDESGTRHLGPMAEDFYEAFELGPDNRHIDLVDSSGLSLAAIQGVLDIIDERDRELTALKQRLATLERLLK